MKWLERSPSLATLTAGFPLTGATAGSNFSVAIGGVRLRRFRYDKRLFKRVAPRMQPEHIVAQCSLF